MKVNVVNHRDVMTGEDIHKSSIIELFDVYVCMGAVGPVIKMLEADPTLAERLPFIKADKEEAKAFRWPSISDSGRRLFANWQVEAGVRARHQGYERGQSLVRPPLRPRLGGRLMNQFRSSPAHFRFLASEGRIPERLEMLEVGPSHADVLPAFEYDIFVHDVKSAYQLPICTRETIDNVRRSIAACNAFVAHRPALSAIESIDDEGASWDASKAVLGRSFASP